MKTYSLLVVTILLFLAKGLSMAQTPDSLLKAPKPTVPPDCVFDISLQGDKAPNHDSKIIVTIVSACDRSLVINDLDHKMYFLLAPVSSFRGQTEVDSKYIGFFSLAGVGAIKNGDTALRMNRGETLRFTVSLKELKLREFNESSDLAGTLLHEPIQGQFTVKLEMKPFRGDPVYGEATFTSSSVCITAWADPSSAP